MKVLVYRYGSICEPDVLQTFREMGFEVEEYNKEITKKDEKPATIVREFGDYLMDHSCDCIFSINFFPYVSEVANLFHIRYLCWIVDSPVMELYSTAIQNEWNRVFLFDKALFEEIAPLNPGKVFHLPLAANVKNKEELFQKTSSTTRRKFSHEVAFVGSLYTEKCPYDKLSKDAPATLTGYLDGIMAAQEKVYGYYFVEDLLTDEIVEEFMKYFPTFYRYPEKSFLTDKRTLSQLYIGNKISANERVHTFTHLSKKFDVSIYTASDTSYIEGIHNMGLAKSLTEMPIIFHQSKINLNITSKAIRYGLPLRIFDILSCGGFVLSNYQLEIPELFTPGEDLVMYGSQEEMDDLIAYYLEHEEERKAIAANGLETLKKNYTYEQQLSKLMLKAYEV
ncbi:MAG: DUF3880 domain-containing protein [Lachnospiraceae bacterium]|nr:DUF3880 domain-containing protein [Lachnospiraceae bacterium]